MARTYIISEICGDWALQIREPGHPHQFLYFNSENNADLVKSILEWEDEHPNEAVPYKPTLTPPNEPLTCAGVTTLTSSVLHALIVDGLLVTLIITAARRRERRTHEHYKLPTVRWARQIDKHWLGVRKLPGIHRHAGRISSA